MNNKVNRKRGFTLVEVMIVIAITIILGALGSVGVIQYQRRLKLMEADAAAKEIFLAAQNRLAASWAMGEWNTILETENESYLGTPITNTEKDLGEAPLDLIAGHTYYRVSTASSYGVLSEVLLPFGSIDDTIRSGSSYVIEYDASTATIFDVYYVEQSGVDISRDDAKTSRLESSSARITYAINNPSSGKPRYVGYYGDGKTDLPPVTYLIEPEIEVFNEENLWVQVKDYNFRNYNDTVLILTIKGALSGHTVNLQVPLSDSNALIDGFTGTGPLNFADNRLAKYKEIANDCREYYILLDSLTYKTNGPNDSIAQFKRQFYDNTIYSNDQKLCPGEDLTISAQIFRKDNSGTLLQSDIAVYQPPEGERPVNSLFATVDYKGSGKYYAVISNARHLQNLSRDASGIDYKLMNSGSYFVPFNLTGAKLDQDIYWETYKDPTTGRVYQGYFDKVQKCPDTAYGGSDICADWKTRTTVRYTVQTALINKEFGSFRPICDRYNNDETGKWPDFQTNFEVDGNNKKIYNLTIYRHESDLGLFGQKKGGNLSVHDLSFVNPSAKADKNNAGIVLGKNQGGKITINNVHVYMSDAGTYKLGTYNIKTQKYNSDSGRRVSTADEGPSAGGLIGTVAGGEARIYNSSASVPVSGWRKHGDNSNGIGGLVGSNTKYLEISNCYVGGYADYYGNDNITKYIDYSPETVNIASLSNNGDNQAAGGLVGMVLGKAVINNCYSTASVYGVNYAGGLFGKITDSSGSINNCYSTGRVFYLSSSDFENYGTFVGQNVTDGVKSKITNCQYFDFSDYEYKIDENIKYALEDSSDAVSTSADELKHNVNSPANPYIKSLGNKYPFTEQPSGQIHYGDWPNPKEAEVISAVEDGNKLALHFTVPRNIENITIKVTGLISENSRYLNIRRDGTNLFGTNMPLVNGNISVTHWMRSELYNTPFLHGYAKKNSDGDYDYTIWLDDPTIDYGTFAYMFCAWGQEDNSLFAGEDINVYLCYGIKEPREEDLIATTNGMFAYEGNLSSRNNNQTAYIENSRHLMNLDTFYSGLNENAFNGNGQLIIRHARQIADIQWEKYDWETDLYNSTILSKRKFLPYLDEVRLISNETGNYKYDVDRVATSAQGKVTGDPNKFNKVISIGNSLLESYDAGIYNRNGELVGVYTLENFRLCERFTNNGIALFDQSCTSLTQISNLKIHNINASSTTVNAAALISYVGLSGKQFTIDNVEVGGNLTTVTGGNNSGGLIGGVGPNVTKVKVNNSGFTDFNSISASGESAGAIIGCSDAPIEISNCYVVSESGIVTGNQHAGGLAGNLANSFTITDSMSSCFVENGSGWGGSGGLIGYTQKNGTISNSYVAGHTEYGKYHSNINKTDKARFNIESPNGGHAGGLVGLVGDGININNSYNTASVYSDIKIPGGARSVGGLIGSLSGDSVTLNGLYTTGMVSEADNRGILIGVCNTSEDNINSSNLFYYSDGILNLGVKQIGNLDNYEPGTAANPDMTELVNNPFINGEGSVVSYDKSLADTYPFKSVTSSNINGSLVEHYGDWYSEGVTRTIEFIANGDGALAISGTERSSLIERTIYKGDTFGTLPTGEWNYEDVNYVLLGWYSSPNQLEGEKLTPETVLKWDTPTIYYAHWGKPVEISSGTFAVEQGEEGVYLFEAWGSGDKASYTSGTMYLEPGDGFDIEIGTEGNLSSIKTKNSSTSFDSRIMVASGNETGYYSAGGDIVSVVSGNVGSDIVSYLSATDDLLFTGQSIHDSGWVFGNSTISDDISNKPEVISADDGYVRVLRLMLGKNSTEDSQKVPEYSDGHAGGNNYTIVSEINNSDSKMIVEYNSELTNEQIKSMDCFLVSVDTTITKKEGKVFDLEDQVVYTLNSVSPEEVELNESCENVFYTLSDGKYKFIKLGSFDNNTWKYRGLSYNFETEVVYDSVARIELYPINEYRYTGETFELEGTITATLIRESGLEEEINVDELTWTSKDESIATVSSNKSITAVHPGNTAITATYSDSIDLKETAGDFYLYVEDRPHLTLTLSNGLTTIVKNEPGVNLNIVGPSGRYIPAYKFTDISSSDSSILEVDRWNNHALTAKKEGKVILSATTGDPDGDNLDYLDGHLTGELEVTVIHNPDDPIVGIAFADNPIKKKPSDADFLPTVNYVYESSEVAPIVDLSTGSWSTGNPDIAYYDSTDGLIHIAGEGNTTITVTVTVGNSTFTATSSLIIQDKPSLSISLLNDADYVNINQETYLKIIGPSTSELFNNVIGNGGTFTCESVEGDVACETFIWNGQDNRLRIKANKTGKIRIYIKSPNLNWIDERDRNVDGEFVVNVMDPIKEIAFEKKKYNILTDSDPFELLVYNVYESGKKELITDKAFTWNSNDTSIATVENGIVSFVGEGTATVTATMVDDETKIATCIVNYVSEIIDYRIELVNGDGWESGAQYRVVLYNNDLETLNSFTINVNYTGTVTSATDYNAVGSSSFANGKGTITFSKNFEIAPNGTYNCVIQISGTDFPKLQPGEKGGWIVGSETNNNQSLLSFRPQLLSISPLNLQAYSPVTEGTMTDLTEDSIGLAEYSLDNDSVTYYKDQNDVSLPCILKVVGYDKTRLVSNDYTWQSSDDKVISYDHGTLSINGIGEAGLNAEIEGNAITLNVIVIDNPKIDRFYAEGEKYIVNDTKYATQKWPTVKPAGLNKKTEYIEGKRIVEESGTYYYIIQDFEADWDELIGNIGRYTEDVDENNDHYVVKLPNSMFLSSEDFDENGNPKFELIPGDVYVGEDGKVYVLINEETNPTEPTGNSEGWTTLRDYVPGLDTGPASDALSYPDSIYNPYPGTLNNNCTWAVWYLANVNVGARLPNWGDAGNWFRRAAISGYSTGAKPAKNSILVMDRHVAYVTDVSEDGTQIYVKEGNIQGKYNEGWWTIDSSRLGMEVYGYIYLVNDEGKTVEAIVVTLESGRHDTLDEFKAYLDELGLELGEGEEVYDNDIPAGKIVSYRSGEVEKGSLINYKISLGPEPVKVTEIDESYVGKSADEFVAYLKENGLEAGVVTTVEGDEDGIVASIKTGTYSETEKVDFSVTKKKAEETPTDVETATEDTDPTADLLKNTKGMSEDKFLEYLKENDLKAADPELVETEDQVLISTIDKAKLGEDGKVHYVVYILKSVDDNIEEVVADPKQIQKEDEGASANNEPVDSNKDQSTSNNPVEKPDNNEGSSGQGEEVPQSEPEEKVEEVEETAPDTQAIPDEQPGEVAEDVQENPGE